MRTVPKRCFVFSSKLFCKQQQVAYSKVLTRKRPHLFFLSISFWHKFDMSDNNERWDWFLFIIYYYSSIINVWSLSQFDHWADGTYFIFYMVCLYLILFAKNSTLYIKISLFHTQISCLSRKKGNVCKNN